MDGCCGVEGQEKLVEAFLGITSTSREEAVFFLESYNWQIDAAVHSYFDNNSVPSSPSHDAVSPSLPCPSPLPPEAPSPLPPHHPTPGKPMSSSSSSSRGKKAARPAGGIRTLADLNRRAAPGSDSDSDGPPEYYTGGEKSGMLVQDPTKGGDSGNDVDFIFDHFSSGMLVQDPTKGGDSGNDVDFIFDQARQLGALEGPIDPVHLSSGSRSFTGRGRLLSGETVSAPQPQEPDVVVHNIVFWRNGFTVNDGPLRRLDDPENASFLESIRKSECPKELESTDRKTAIHVNLIRKEENRPEPEKHQVRFQGIGRTLGGGSTSDQIPANQTAASIPTDAPAPSPGLVVDDTKPSTSIQLRLADGTRMVARFNYHHTLADIRAFIDASRPGGSRGYQLQTVGFPPKQLADSSQTIEQAGLANSVVIQKL